MRYLNYSLLAFALSLFISNGVFAQFPGCPNVDAGPDQTLPCSVNCTNLTATPFHAGGTTTYAVSAIPHTPPIAYNEPGGTAVSVGTDDVFSPVVNLPFNFCYFGTTYTTCYVGSNGGLKMGAPGTNNVYAFTANCPAPALSAQGDIFGVLHDTDPTKGSPTGTVKWYLTGTAPCRIFVVVFSNLAHYGSSCSAATYRSTSMIVLYETTNAIDVYVQSKPLCTAWNGGNAIIGIQNPAGTAGLAAPGRNASPTWSANTPEGWRFTPNGAPIYSTAWFQGATQIGVGNTVNVCPTATTTYTARTTYSRCDGTQIIETDNVTVGFSSLVAASVSPSNETCANYNNGGVTIDNPVGAGPYTVNISGPASGSVVEPNTAAGVASFTNLPDGSYTYTVTGNNGCTTTGTFTIGAGPVCCSVTASATNVLCNGAATGSTTSNPVGLAPFTYSWTGGGQTGQTATNLGVGTYTVTMTDNSGCVATASATITGPTAVTATAALVHPSCNGSCNGTITLTASGGTGPYQYSLNGGAFQVSNVFTGLCSGSYSITVRDANNCTFILSPALTQPAVLNLALGTIVPATCGLNNGSVTVSASGGTVAYSYSIGGAGQASPTFTGLAAGSYTVTVTDSKGCTKTVTAVVPAQNSPVASIISQQNVSCFGGVNGSVLIGGTGGVAPLTYSLNGGPFQASNSFGSLSAGTYTATVKDANGCTNTVSFTITSPAQLSFTSAPTAALCNGACNGQIAITATGGTAPYQFSSNNGGSYSTANPMTGLCAGPVSVVIMDNNGCLANSTVNITQPAPLSATFALTHPVCNNLLNGSVSVTPSGGTPAYQYSANGGPSQPSLNLTGLGSGNNVILITDAHGCQFSSTQVLVDPPAMTLTQTSNVSSNCGFNNGSITVSGSGVNNPFTYSINGGAFQTSGSFTNLLAGAYHIYVKDALGCIDSVFFGVNDVEMEGIVLAQTDVTCFDGTDGTIEVLNVSGAPPIVYELDNTPPTQTSGFFDNIAEGSHVVTIYDNGLCVYTLPFTMIQPTEVTFTANVTNIACNGANTGSIQFGAPSGGTGTYEYSVDNGVTFQPGNTFNGLAAGTYNLAVKDGANCIVYGTATITQAPPVTFTFSKFDLTCFGNNSGFIQLVAAGGTPTYQYSIDNGATFGTSDNFSPLAAGTYSVVVRDAALCTVTGTVTLTEPALLTATSTPTPTTCNAVCDGEIAVVAGGGTTPYQYSADNGVTFGVTPGITGLCAGTYTVVVKDSKNCTVSAPQTITQPSAVTFTTALTPATCSLANGEINITATGGIPTYNYSIDNGATTVPGNVFPGLAAASYDLIVTDANGCEETAQVTIVNMASPVITGIFTDEPLCNAACDGQITITATGGTGTLDYSIGGAAQAGTVFNGICAGNYTITITDDNGCTDSDVTTIAEPAPLAFTTVLTNLTCFQDNTGEIAFTATGGTTPYEYSIDNAATYTTQNNLQFLAAGTYNLSVKDNQNCTATAQVQLTEPAEVLIQSQNSTDASCHGFCDGDATVTVTGGTIAGSYNYDWAGAVAGPTANTASSLCAGTYALDITDDNGCAISTSFNITEPPLLVITSTTGTDVLCNGACDGTITINSALAVQFSVDNGATYQASNVFTGLCAGTYTIVVRDAAGCTQSGTIVINEPAPLVQNPIPENGLLICYDGYGTLSGSATGGVGPYYYVWNATDTVQYLNVNLTAPATFTCIVYDQNGCASGPQSANVTVRTPFVASVLTGVSVCPGGEATITASGQGGLSGYSYEWLTTPAHDTLGNGSSFSYFPSTTETILMVAHDECYRYDTLPVLITIYAPPTPTFTVDPAIGCSPLTATFTNDMPAGTVASSAWAFGDGSAGNGTTTTHVYTEVGCYDVTLDVVSAEGCAGTVTVQNVVCVAADPVAQFTFNPQAPTTVNSFISFTDQSSNAVSYNWDFSGLGSSVLQNPSFNFGDIDPGEQMICLTVTSEHGCIDRICKPISFAEEFTMYVPNTFTPDDDEFNPMFTPIFPADAVISDYTLIIFDRWGEVLFESHNTQIGWDGAYHDQICKEGVYTWRVIVAAENTKSKEYTGHVTLIR